MNVLKDENDDSVAILEFMGRRWKAITIIVVASLAAAAVITLCTPKQYLASAIVFPAHSNSVESVIENPTFGYDIEADRLVQMLQSDVVFDSICRHFRMVEYYDIDQNNPDWRDRLLLEYNEDVNFQRTQYMSIVISARTRNPELSADIVNYIIDISNEIRNRIYKQNILIAYQAIEKEYLAKRTLVDGMEKEIAILRSKATAELVVVPNSPFVIQAKGDRASSELNTQLERAMNMYIYEQSRLNDISARYEKAKAQYERPVTQVFVLDRAIPSYKKVSPSWIVNLSVAAGAALLFSIFFFLVMGRLKSSRNN
ncbi:MAG TPA: Wzz/FepE/Etk N-terminal domain-containing protein [Bacteroidia bacterium]|nr:Wzz/FepE/Etk N-terminal domain-containing protein [Bacteroidia bacterium]